VGETARRLAASSADIREVLLMQAGGLGGPLTHYGKSTRLLNITAGLTFAECREHAN
jgi:hypothetical protein